jgi:hypothetical protein
LSVGELSWRPGPFHRALAALPVRFPPTATVQRPEGERQSYASPLPALVTEPPTPEPDHPRSGWTRLLSWWRGE